MKKDLRKKLSLTRQTIANLNDREMGLVKGGGYGTYRTTCGGYGC